jgi:hypothetical protein
MIQFLQKSQERWLFWEILNLGFISFFQNYDKPFFRIFRRKKKSQKVRQWNVNKHTSAKDYIFFYNIDNIYLDLSSYW